MNIPYSPGHEHEHEQQKKHIFSRACILTRSTFVFLPVFTLCVDAGYHILDASSPLPLVCYAFNTIYDANCM